MPKSQGKTKPQKPPRKTEADKSRDHTLAMKRWDVIGTITSKLVIGGVAALIVYLAIPLPMYYAHGETTTIRYVIKWAVGLSIDRWLLGFALAGTTTWAKLLKRKLLRERKEKDARIKELEQELDRRRTSSNLTTDGSDAGKATQ